MNKEELREKYIEKYSGPGYSYVKKEDKELELRLHDLLVDIMTHEASANMLISMLPVPCWLPGHVLDESYLDEILDFESMIVHHDILDDGEFWVLYDPETDSWLLDDSYELLERAPEVCERRGLDFSTAEAVAVEGWRRRNYVNGAGETAAILGIEDLITILERVKTGDFSGLRDKIPLKSLKKRYGQYERS